MSDQEGGGTRTSASGLSEAERMMRYDASKKSTLLAYVIWFFFAAFAGHRFYLRRYQSAVIMLLLWVAGVFLITVALVMGASESGESAGTLMIIAVIVFMVPVIWIFVDLFLIPGIVRRYNNDIIDRLQN
jgi:TM2 domain-containing membrane protein YozV